MVGKIVLSPDHKAVKLYFIKPDRKLEFLDFYKKSIIPWLYRNDVKMANVWVVDRQDCLVLTVALDRDDNEWYLIDGLEDYIDGPLPPPIQPRPELDIVP